MKPIFVTLVLVSVLTSCASGSIFTKPLSGDPVSATNPKEAEQVLSETERLNLWFDERFEERLSRWPTWMTSLGRKDRYGEIDDYSEAAEDEALKSEAHAAEYLTTNFDYDALSEDAKVSYSLWLYEYESWKAMVPFRRNEYVFSHMFGPQSELPKFLINYHRVEEESDLTAYVSRIHGVSRAIDQLLVRANAAAEEGVRPPRFTYDIVLSEAREQLHGAPFADESDKDAPLWADVQEKIKQLRDADVIDATRESELTAAARTALLQSFQPAYSRLISWFEADYENSDVFAKGVGTLPNGKAYYDALLADRTTLPLSAEEVHETGLSEVARLRGEMEGIMQRVGFEGSLEDFFEFVKTDKQFYYANDDAGRQRYIDDTKSYLGFINNKIPEYFGLLPKADLIVKRVESFREQDGGAPHYNTGTPDGTRPGVYYLHLSDMSANPLTEMESTAYHEGNPGHHMERSISQELTGIPMFRTQAWFYSYVEGWALYSELLAKEMGAYQDPYSDFGRLTLEIWRAIRLVVDTGIHAKGWSEEQAVTYFSDNSPVSDAAIRSEVQRYFVMPAQATSYKIGMLKIQELRKNAEIELGDRFDIRDFHDTILGGGPVPLTIMERMVDDWIERRKAS